MTALKSALDLLGLRPGRYYAWVSREQQCQVLGATGIF